MLLPGPINAQSGSQNDASGNGFAAQRLRQVLHASCGAGYNDDDGASATNVCTTVADKWDWQQPGFTRGNEAGERADAWPQRPPARSGLTMQHRDADPKRLRTTRMQRDLLRSSAGVLLFVKAGPKGAPDASRKTT